MALNVDVHVHKQYRDVPDTLRVTSADVKWWQEPNKSEPYTAVALMTDEGAINIYGMDLEDLDDLIGNLQTLRGRLRAANAAYEAHKREVANA